MPVEHASLVVRNVVMKYIQRKPNRLKDYDYSQNGAYFITICTHKHKPILSHITVGTTIGRLNEVTLTQIGTIVQQGIMGMNEHYENVFVDNYVIMPNHIHLLIRLDNPDGRAMLVPTVSRVIQQFKGYVSKQVGKPIWQEKFYDHIIRDEYDYFTKWQYIDDNPAKWADDKLFTK